MGLISQQIGVEDDFIELFRIGDGIRRQVSADIFFVLSVGHKDQIAHRIDACGQIFRLKLG